MDTPISKTENYVHFHFSDRGLLCGQKHLCPFKTDYSVPSNRLQ